MSARRKTSSRPTSSTPSSARHSRVGEGIMGDELHVERLQQPEQLGADIADADRAERAADQADAHMLAACAQSRRGPSRVSRSLIISLPVSARMKVRIETATGRRTPSGVMTRAMPALRAGLDVDGVVADAEARDDGEPAIGVDALRAKRCASRISASKSGELLGPHRIRRLEIGDLDAGRAAQRLEVEIGIDRRAIGLAEIAGEGDAKRRGHALSPCSSSARSPRASLPIASASASCSTQTSPE